MPSGAERMNLHTTADDLLTQCRALLNELEEFKLFLAQYEREHKVELRQFQTSVTSELKSLEKLSKADPTAERTIHTLRSSNLPFYTAVWTTAKSCTGLVCFSKRFYWETPPPRRLTGTSKRKKRCARVDIVAQDGEEWVKVSTITESRLLFEKAEAGWEDPDSPLDSEGEDGMTFTGQGSGLNSKDVLENGAQSGDDDDDDRIELLKMAEDLQRAARAIRVRYKHPRVRFVLPKIIEGQTPAIDSILADIRATGAVVQCANDLPSVSVSSPAAAGPNTYANGTTNPLSTIFSRLLTNPLSTLTTTLKIDCTILLALVSDLSHISLLSASTLHRAVRRQIDLEAKERLLPSSLYPAMIGRSLVCTAIAARRMREIVTQIGTPSERLRTELLLGEGDAGTDKTAEALRVLLAGASEYEVPSDLQLPIRVESGVYELERLPAVARRVEARLTEINRSVFLYGWMRGWTTVSSNRTVAKLVEAIVEGEGGEEDMGPMVWLCGTARSLVGKEKGRRE